MTTKMLIFLSLASLIIPSTNSQNSCSFLSESENYFFLKINKIKLLLNCADNLKECLNRLGETSVSTISKYFTEQVYSKESGKEYT